ncbi:MAG TPA: HEAT repeat domain-containing protein [Bryobacteraceae bacterium]|nr:HEAT repeat domain-containing protein [Bryobacteraceae bacterium]
MTCQQVQTNLSLYLYGELDFAQEEGLERHLEGCALCQRAFAREKAWHISLNAEQPDVSLELLSECRRNLRSALKADGGAGQKQIWWYRFFPSGFSPTRWSAQVAVASFLVFVGFAAARLIDSGRVKAPADTNLASLGVIDPSNARVRDIQPAGENSVRIVVDRLQQQEITGKVDDDAVRQLLIAAMQDPTDPGIRVDSVELLQHQSGSDVRDALLNTVRQDSNAAVRMKALQGLQRFSNDPATRQAIEFVLKHDSNPDVRSEAIDILVPADRPVGLMPDVLTTLQDILNSERENDYVRSRSLQVLRAVNASGPIY